jgi:hypothetical protein
LAVTLTAASIAGSATIGSTALAIKLMTITKLQAAIAGALLIAGVAAPLAVHHQAKLRAENNALQSQLDQLSGLRAENERLTRLIAEASNSPSSAQEQLGELLRLRNEVGILRHQTNELARLAAQRQKSNSTANTANQNQQPIDGFPKESWTFMGYADPEAALQTALWARNSGDAKAYLASVAPEGSEFKEFNGKPEDAVSKELPKELREVSAYKVLDREFISDDDVVLTVFADGVKEQAFFEMRRYGNDWKLVGVDKSRKAALSKQSAPTQASGQ